MKKKNKDINPFDTQCWCYDGITDPYQVFAEAFSHTGMAHLRRVIKKILHYAEAEEIYKERSPCDVLQSMRVIRSLIKAAHTLKEKKNGPIQVSEGDVFNKKYYCSHYQPSSAWDDFPRFLSIREFCNPYRVFKKFFKYQPIDQWVHDLEEAVDCALMRNSGEMDLDMLAVYSHLAKLVEAAHLINVREVTHIGGMLKNRG